MLITMMFLVSSHNTFRRKRQIIFPDSDLWKKIISSSAAENPDLSPDTNENMDLLPSKTNENPGLLTSKTNKNPDLSPNTNENSDLSPAKANENPDLLPKTIENHKSNVKLEPRVVNGIRKPKNQVGFATPIITTKKAHYMY